MHGSQRVVQIHGAAPAPAFHTHGSTHVHHRHTQSLYTHVPVSASITSVQLARRRIRRHTQPSPLSLTASRAYTAPTVCMHSPRSISKPPPIPPSLLTHALHLRSHTTPQVCVRVCACGAGGNPLHQSVGMAWLRPSVEDLKGLLGLPGCSPPGLGLPVRVSVVRGAVGKLRVG
jgi:hypothetical protein